MKPTIKKRGKKLSEKRLATLEKKFGVPLPGSYRAFMLEYNGGSPEPNRVCRKRQKKPTEVCHLFLHMDSERDFDDWSKAFETLKDKEAPVLPLRMVPIASDPFGNYFCISVSGKDSGRIYFWHHEESFVPEPPRKVVPDDSGISLMADSFDDFLNQFAEDEEDEPYRREAPNWEALVEAGDVHGIRKWLDQGGNVCETNGNGATPLYLAIDLEQDRVVELLLGRGADAQTALAVALELNRWGMAQAILRREKGRKFQIGPMMFAEALHGCDDIQLIRALLDAGAQIDGESYGDNPLHSATLFKGNPGIVKLLLDRGAKLEQSSDSRDALANCICLGNLEAAKLLLKAGANLYADPNKKTKTQIKVEGMIKAEENKPKPDRGMIEMFKQHVEHERTMNAPKAPIHYFNGLEKRIPKSFKEEIVKFAAGLGQKPPIGGGVV